MENLLDRIEAFSGEPFQSEYIIVIEDPRYPEDSSTILIPDPFFIAGLMAGGIYPSIDVYLRDRERPQEGAYEHVYAEPAGPMTEKQAIEYVIMKDVDPYIWRDYKGNRKILQIVRRQDLPDDIAFVDAWKINQEVRLDEAA